MSAGTGPSADVFVEILREVRRFVRERVVPLEERIDDTDQIPQTLREQAKQMGLFGFATPCEYGGIGLTLSQEVELAIELGWTTPAFRAMFGTNNGIAGDVLLLGGTPEQKRSLLPRLASGDLVAAFALTEPEAGSSPADLSTSARAEDGDWVIDGLKRFITNAPEADLFMVFARTSKEDRAIDGISAFVVSADTPGIAVGPAERKMGQHGAHVADVTFDGVRVGVESLVGGAVGGGYRTALSCLAHGRVHIAAICVGLANRLVHESVSWATQRSQGGKPIIGHQLVAAMVADSQAELMAARALVREVAGAYDAGTDTRLGPASAKLFCSEMVGRVADRAVQIHGGAGYVEGTVERLYRDARLFRIYEGTSEIQKLVIAGELARSR